MPMFQTRDGRGLLLLQKRTQRKLESQRRLCSAELELRGVRILDMDFYSIWQS